MMFTTREIAILLAGAQTFHTLSHILIMYTGSLPIKVFSFRWTKDWNLGAIMINAAITAALFWWISML